MNRTSTQSDILTAERQLARAQLETRVGFERVRLAVRARLARPSSLLVATGLGALLGVWLARRNKTPVGPETVVEPAPLPGLVTAFLIRFGLQRLAGIWQHLRTFNPLRSGTDAPAPQGREQDRQ